MAKVIKNLNVNLSDMAASGGARLFSIEGDVGAIFSLEVKNEDGYYYNFSTNTFAAAESRLKQQAIRSNEKYDGNILFPSITDNDQYDIYLFVHSAYDTVHADYKEVRFGDGSIDINSSKGSNSNLLQKVIYQYTDVTITISPRSPDAIDFTTGNFVSATYGTDTIVVGRGKNTGKKSFSISVTTATTKALQILRQPAVNDIVAFTAVTLGTGVKIPGEDIWTGATDTDTVDGAVSSTKIVMDSNVSTKMTVGDKVTGTATTDTVDGAVTSGIKVVMDNNVATKMAVGDLITGNTALDAGVVTVAELNPDGDNAKEFSMSEAIAISDGVTLTFNSELNRKDVTVVALNPDGDNVKEFSITEEIAVFDGMTLTFTTAKYYRWSINSSSSIHKLLSGMQLINPDVQTAVSTISSYEDTTAYTTESWGGDGSISQLSNIVTNVSIPALDPVGNKPVITNGLVSQQLGYITFADQVSYTSLGDAVVFYASGADAVKAINNAEIKLTNLKVELTKPTTTTTEATTAHATIAVADREGVINNVSTVSGIGINASAANPTITSGGGADGAGDWVMGAVQTLENGITLTVEGTSRVATITGNIEALNVQDTDFTLYFNIDNFLSAS